MNVHLRSACSADITVCPQYEPGAGVSEHMLCMELVGGVSRWSLVCQTVKCVEQQSGMPGDWS